MPKRKTIKPIDLEKTINEILTQYGDDVYKVLGNAVEMVSQEATRKLQAVTTFSTKGHPSGAYSRDWRADDDRAGRWQKKKVIHNADHYRLAHLLEKGHVSRNGTGRTFGNVKAYPHIKPVEEWAVQELPRKVEELIHKV